MIYAIKMTSITWQIHTMFHEDWYRHQSSIKVMSQIFQKLQCWYYWWNGIIMHAIGMASCGTIYLQRFIKIGRGFQAISRLFFSEIWRAVVWCEWFMNYAVEMDSVVLIYISGLTKIASVIQNLLWWDTHAYLQIHRRHKDLIRCFYFFKIKEVSQKRAK
jgi:hypothetical protein